MFMFIGHLDWTCSTVQKFDTNNCKKIIFYNLRILNSFKLDDYSVWFGLRLLKRRYIDKRNKMNRVLYKSAFPLIARNGYGTSIVPLGSRQIFISPVALNSVNIPIPAPGLPPGDVDTPVKFRWTSKVIKPEDVKLHRVYPGDEDKDIPDMDPRCIPAFKRLRRKQALYQRDDGLPLHMKTPYGRIFYRFMCLFTICQTIFHFGLMAFCIIND